MGSLSARCEPQSWRRMHWAARVTSCCQRAGYFLFRRGRIEISNSLSIVGEGADRTIVDGANGCQFTDQTVVLPPDAFLACEVLFFEDTTMFDDRVFVIENRLQPTNQRPTLNVQLSGLTVQNGGRANSSQIGAMSLGADTSVTVVNSVFRLNVGGIVNSGGLLRIFDSTIGPNSGTGIANSGTAQIQRSAISGNNRVVTFGNNPGIVQGPAVDGGGIYNFRGRLEITNSTDQ